MPAEQPQPLVTPCFRCGQAAENPALGHGRDWLPLCTDCLDLLRADAPAF